MKLKEYIAGLQELAEKNPETLEMEVIASQDDEGNGYDRVCFGPSIYTCDDDGDDYQSLENALEDWDEDDGYDKPVARAVCVN